MKYRMWNLSIGLIVGLSALCAGAALGAQEPQPVGLRTYDYPAASPDGALIAFSSNVDGDHDIYLMDVATGAVEQLTDNDELDGSPVWTPDGAVLIFQGERGGNRDIFSMDLDTGETRNLTNHPAEDSHPKVSADGRWIVFDSNRASPDRIGVNDFSANYEIYRMPIEGGSAERLTRHDHWDTYADLSPDGRFLIWRRILEENGTRNSEIFWKDLETGEERNLTNHPAFDGYPDWTPDGRILFSSNRAGQTRDRLDVHLLDPQSGNIERLTFAGDSEAFRRVTRPRAEWGGEWTIANRYADPYNHIIRFRLDRDSQAPFTFTRMASSPVSDGGGLSRGVAIADGNGDGLADIFIANTIAQPDMLFWNEGDGRFRRDMEAAITRPGGWTEGVNWVDVDNDGDLDLFAARTEDASVLFLNDGSGGFTQAPESDLTTSATSDSEGCWADVDGDSLLDVVLATRDGADPVLFMNQGAGRFIAADPNPFAGAGGNARSCAFGDADADGDLDLAIANFVTVEGEDVRREEGLFFLNIGGGRFESSEIPGFTDTGSVSYGLSWADPDADGDMDLTETRIGISDAHPGWYRNNGRADFQEAYNDLFADIRHGPSKGHVWADFDNDGDLDFFVANGTEGIESTEEFRFSNVLFENQNGVLRAVDAGPLTEAETISAGAAAGDIDNDGDLDLVIANWGGSDEDNALFRNDGATGNWLLLDLEGRRSNRMGVGATIRARAVIDDEPRTQTRQILIKTGYASASDPRAHFGFGDAETVEWVEIRWPSGQVDRLENASTNQILTVVEGEHP